MTATDQPPRRAMYFLNPSPPPVLTQAALDAMDKDPEGIALVQAIHDRNGWVSGEIKPALGTPLLLSDA